MVEKIAQFGADFWQTMVEMSPYLILGFMIAGLLSVWISSQWVERNLGKRGFWSLFKASLFGVPLPLCSCGVLPVTMSIRKSGASKGASIAFLLSTPQTGVDSILVTFSLMGPIIAVFRPIAAFATGLIGGAAVELMDDGNRENQQDNETEEPCSCCHKKEFWLKRALKHGFVTLPRDIAKGMLIGLIVAGGISTLVPDDFFAPILGGGIVSMIVMILLGVPVYVCATASVPIAVSLIDKGLSPGTAMVFLMTGPATNAAALATIWAGLGKKTAVIYIITVIVCAISGGLILDYLFPELTMPFTSHSHVMGSSILGHLSAVFLLGLLIYSIISENLSSNKAEKG